MTAIYNEIDAYAARWIGNLIAADLVAPGMVDARSISQLTAEDVRHVTQAHFFAGIAVWSAAARAAGWPDDAPIWSGSCPCQPFSQAGRGGGISDERHLWPEWFRLIRQCRPPVVVGEQVASPAGLGWLDAVLADLEGEGYAVGAVDFGAASVGAPHQRQRLYFVAMADGEPLDGLRAQLRESRRGRGDGPVELGDAGSEGGRRDSGSVHLQERRSGPSVPQAGRRSETGAHRCGCEGGYYCTDPGCDFTDVDRERLADAKRHDGTGRISQPHGRAQVEPDRHGAARGSGAMAHPDEPHPLHGVQPRGWRLVQPAPHATSGFWSPADWIHCLDGKARPVEPGTFPLAHGATARVGRLRAYGNAIVRPQAQVFLESVIDVILAPTRSDDGGAP